MNSSHLDALNIRLSHERGYLAKAKTENERELRKVWIAQIEKEIAREEDRLGIQHSELAEMTDDEILAELLA